MNEVQMIEAFEKESHHTFDVAFETLLELARQRKRREHDSQLTKIRELKQVSEGLVRELQDKDGEGSGMQLAVMKGGEGTGSDLTESRWADELRETQQAHITAIHQCSSMRFELDHTLRQLKESQEVGL